MVGLLPCALLAQEERPSVTITTIDEEITVDGDLSESAWSRAARITEMTELEPSDGIPADPKTEILLMRSKEYLYVAFICHEPEIDRLVLQDMHRDAFQEEDDAVKIALDTFRDRKTGYYFLLSAAGSRLDAIVANNGQRLNFSWNGFWEARSQILEDRWIAEFAIPFMTMAFKEDGSWGVNFERWRGPNRARYRWAGARLELRVTTMSETGVMYGMEGIEQGLGLEFRPYGKIKHLRDHENDSVDTEMKAGGEVIWRITPQLTGSVTVNTDFAETEADTRQINLTRFPITFPEKRFFFLQDSNLFQFGWESAFGGRGRPNLLPYFSRRIGLSSNGEEIPIDYGARLAGRIDKVDLGFLAVHTRETSTEEGDIPSGNLVVARPAYQLSDESVLGGIFTYGNPESDDENAVGGLDFRYTSTEVLPGLLSATGYMLYSNDDEMREQGGGYGFQSSLDMREWNFALETVYAQDEFHPGLGFVRRPDERRYLGQLQWAPRPKDSVVRNWDFSITPSIWTEPDHSVISSSLDTDFLGIEFQSGDEITFTHQYNTDKLDEAFEPVDGSVIPAGEYDWQSLQGRFEFSPKRPLSGQISYEGGNWYNGTRTRLSGQVQWIPIPNLEFKGSYTETQARIPGPDFTTRLETLTMNIDFSPDIRLATLVQADNVTDSLGLQSRFHWIFEDGRELFFVVNASWVEEIDGAIVPVGQDYAAKIVYAVRF